MKNMGGNRSTIGVGGSGSGSGSVTTAPIVTASLNAGTTDVTHALGAAPDIVEAFDSTGTPLLIDWAAKVGSETTEVVVTFAMAAANCKFKFSKNA